MNYAEKILRKYGWQKGKGLGRDENGVSKPIKCNLKFDKAGIGYNEKVSEETTNRWWERVYNETASKIGTSNEKSKGNSKTEGIRMAFNNMTDEELFEACGGRTAHKAARHGLKLNGKLERIKAQEAVIMSSDHLSDKITEVTDTRSQKKSEKKRKAVRDDDDQVGETISCQSADLEISTENSVSKKRRKRKAKIEVDEDNKTSDAGGDELKSVVNNLKKREKSKRGNNDEKSEAQ